MTIIISKDFTETPGARYRHEGSFSGEEFREDILIPKFKQVQENNEKLLIDLDGGYGYPTSFLEEAFGGLSRVFGSKKVLEVLSFKSEDEPSLIATIENYIRAGSKI